MKGINAGSLAACSMAPCQITAGVHGGRCTALALESAQCNGALLLDLAWPNDWESSRA